MCRSKMAFQFQTSYREKVRQFYTDYLKYCSQVIENIVMNISSLFGAVFQVQYLNEENTWITLSETPADIQDMFRCSKIVAGADFKRIKLRIVEGASPAVETNKLKTEDSPAENKHPKRLRFEDDFGAIESYRTPIELDIQRKRDVISHLESELSYYEEQHDVVSAKYSMQNTRGSRLGRQCGKCHLYQNHRKNNCPNDTCISAQMRGDVSKDIDETAELRDIEAKKRKLNFEIRKERQELESKIKCAEKVNATFSKRMERHLIEPDRKKYLVSTMFGIKPRQAFINEHLAILEKHYRGKLPSDIDFEKTMFASIINKAMSSLPKREESVKHLLENNPVHPVKYPGPSASSSRPPSPPLPPESPPLPPNNHPMSPYSWYGYPAFPSLGFYQPWPDACLQPDCCSQQTGDSKKNPESPKDKQ